MKKERFKSSMTLLYVFVSAVALSVFVADYKDWLLNDYLFAVSISAILLIIVYLSTIHLYLEIQNNRTLINSGYNTFGKNEIDIFNIVYIYRHPEFILKWYGSRMVFYIRIPEGKLRQSSLREINYSNETIIKFLTRIKEINPNIELDHEYKKIIKGEIEKNEPSHNTLKSVEARLQEKGENW